MNPCLPSLVILLPCCLLAAQVPPPPESTPAGMVEGGAEPAPTPQQPPRGRRPLEDKAAAAAGAGIAAALDDPDLLLFDQPEPDGALWARGGNYKASFDDRGWTFYPRPRAGAPDLEPLRFELAGVRVDGLALAVGVGRPRRDDRRIEFAHGDVVQRLDVDSRGVEQSFVFQDLPQRGELVVDLAVATTLAGTATAEGLAFTSAHVHVTYSRAVAIDAVGGRTDCETTLADGRIAIRVPAAFVARAVLPIVIDPLVASVVVAAGTTGDLVDPDVAAFTTITTNGTFDSWTVVWAQFFGSRDWDCYAQHLGANLAGVGSPIAIDITTSGWQRPRIASLNHVALVVAQVRFGTDPIRIRGRTMARSLPTPTTVGPQFDISDGPGDDLRPDVGGDPGGGLVIFRGGYFTVVWENAFRPTDHDIHARQVDQNGGLRGSQPILIQTDGQNQTNPSISKSCGGETSILSPSPQRFAIVYQQTAGVGNEDIHGALLTWDGNVVPVNGSNTFPIDTSSANDVFPQVSSPTTRHASGRRILAVYERTSLNSGDIAATCFDHDGTVLARGNVNVLENDPVRLGWPQRRPSVDSDGVRFGVAYHELWQNNTTLNDLDTRMSLVALAGSSLMVEEAGATLGFRSDREFHVQVASRYSADGTLSPRYCAANDRDNLDNTFAIDAYAYDGLPTSSVTTRPTACGALAIVPQGNTTIGSTIAFQITPPPLLAGFVAGAATTAPVAPCPGCTIGASGSTLFGGALSIQIPSEPMFIGLPLAVQGFGFDSAGPCLGQIHLTDTIDFTVQ